MWFLIVIISVANNPAISNDGARHTAVVSPSKAYMNEFSCKNDVPKFSAHLHDVYGGMDVKIEGVTCEYAGENV